MRRDFGEETTYPIKSRRPIGLAGGKPFVPELGSNESRRSTREEILGALTDGDLSGDEVRGILDGARRSDITDVRRFLADPYTPIGSQGDLEDAFRYREERDYGDA